MTVALLIPVVINGDRAIVTDPCYYDGTEYAQHEVKEIQQGGQWKMETHRESFGVMGVRTAELSVTHSTWDSDDAKLQTFSAGVDSGQMSICGIDDVEQFKNPDDYGPNGFDAEGHRGLFDYQGACDITINSPDRAGVLCDVMAVSQSGCGDGLYPVYVWRNKNGFATKIMIDFRDETDDGDGEDWDEEEDG